MGVAYASTAARGNSLAETGPERDAARVIEREAAVRAVEERLERDYQQWRAVKL
ncbi:hypothetical protein STENM36S_04964 [Streptomyces tendae]